MCSPEGPEEESYAFFENVVDYIKKGKSDESNAESQNAQSNCNSFMISYGHYFTEQKTAKIICEQFIKLYYSLNKLNCNLNRGLKNKNCSDFLNYWVNFKLKESIKNEDYTVRNVYDHLESQITGTGEFGTDLVCIHNINMNDLNKMNILYSLYDKYTDIDGILENRTSGDTKLLLSHSTACCTDYLEANYICNGGNDNNNNNHSKFCTQLKKFETTYANLYNRVDGNGSEYINNFKRLAQCKDTNVISTALVGTTVGLVPLLVGLYKFTPLRQLINSNKGKLTQGYRNNDDEMRNIMLMDQGSENISSQQGTYNIKYHSV
ncbi:Plasmodium vivax Vir protein, putative [Plasmodium vivax]|uniref:Vir protein, putative n=1 Tax=Plasmodium vivax TaxID=5855 RepID=A0A1G4E9Z0_PLAVI|nr:Plasmodium vivax Vir protein, putative [Plasmodium vivax]